jgi:hypothetical protein
MFCVSKGPLKRIGATGATGATGYPLYADGTSKYNGTVNLDTLTVSNSLIVEGATGAGGSIKDGLMRTIIPLSVQPPGESVLRRPTNREIPSILLVDF